MRLIGADCDVPLGINVVHSSEGYNASVFLSSQDCSRHIKFNKDYSIKEYDNIAGDLIQETRSRWENLTGEKLDLTKL